MHRYDSAPRGRDEGRLVSEIKPWSDGRAAERWTRHCWWEIWTPRRVGRRPRIVFEGSGGEEWRVRKPP